MICNGRVTQKVNGKARQDGSKASAGPRCHSAVTRRRHSRAAVSPDSDLDDGETSLTARARLQKAIAERVAKGGNGATPQTGGEGVLGGLGPGIGDPFTPRSHGKAAEGFFGLGQLLGQAGCFER
jgi:hypothetical protein